MDNKEQRKIYTVNRLHQKGERNNSTRSKIQAERRQKRGNRLGAHTGAAMTPHNIMLRGQESRGWALKSNRGEKEMNRNVERAQLDIEKVDAIMKAIENTYLDLEVVPDEAEKYDSAVTAFYALWDLVGQVREDINRLTKDLRIIDVVEATQRSQK